MGLLALLSAGCFAVAAVGSFFNGQLLTAGVFAIASSLQLIIHLMKENKK